MLNNHHKKTTKNLPQLQVQLHNKQNIVPANTNHQPHHPPATHPKDQKANIYIQCDSKLLILRDSALSAIISKNIEIENILEQSSSNAKRQLNLVQLQVVGLKDRIGVLQNDKMQLIEQIEQLQSRGNRRQMECNLERQRLYEQIEEYKVRISLLQSYTEEIGCKFNDIVHQTNQIYRDLKQLRLENESLKEMVNRSGGDGYGDWLGESGCQNDGSVRVHKDDDLKKSKVSQKVMSQKISTFLRQCQTKDNKRIQNNMLLNKYKQVSEQSKLIQQIICYQTQQWFENAEQIDYSLPNSPHCLKASLKSINLIENYSQHSKTNEDSQSQFTMKYFKYGTQNHFALQNYHNYDSFENIPEQPEQELIEVNQQRKQQNIGQKQEMRPCKLMSLWQRSGYFIGGVLVGALVTAKLW